MPTTRDATLCNAESLAAFGIAIEKEYFDDYDIVILNGTIIQYEIDKIQLK